MLELKINSPATVDEGETYTVRLTITNQSTKAGAPVGVTMGVGINAGTEFTVLIPIQISSEYFSPSETRTFNYTMPVPAGSGGEAGLITAWVEKPDGSVIVSASEDVIIKAPVTLPFTFSNVYCIKVVMTEATAWRTIEWYCTITNPNNASITQPLKLMKAPQPSLGYYEPRLHSSFNLTLAPGQSYNYKWDGNLKSPDFPYFTLGPAVGDTQMCMYLEDEWGNMSAQCCIVK